MVRPDGAVECWGFNEDPDGNVVGQATPPPGEFASVSAGTFHTCGVRTGGSVECWGSNEDGRATPPSGEFASVSAGWDHTCGVRTDGSVACWGVQRGWPGHAAVRGVRLGQRRVWPHLWGEGRRLRQVLGL